MVKFNRHSGAKGIVKSLGETKLFESYRVAIIHGSIDQIISRIFLKLRFEKNIKIGEDRWDEIVNKYLEFTNAPYYHHGWKEDL